MHRVFQPSLSSITPGATVSIPGEEARHATRVKRLEAGDTLTLCDGRGTTAPARVVGVRKVGKSGEWQVDVEVDAVERHPAPSPRVEVWASAPKGDRLETMIDGLSQADAAAWAPLLTQRTVVEPRQGKLQRLHRVTTESMKQCGRAWELEILEGGAIAAALQPAPATARVVVADAAGGAYLASGAELIRVLIGPEGGFTDDELAGLRRAGAAVARFGPHTMRIETAAVVAAAMVVEAEHAARRG